MKVLVDLDSLLYVAVYKIISFGEIRNLIRAGYDRNHIEQKIVSEADEKLSNMCYNFLNELEESGFAFEAEDVEYYITNDIFSFRKAICENYKSNRKSNKWVGMFRRQIIERNQALFSLEHEADDLIANRAKQLNYECVICTSDKDLNQIPGWKFDIYKEIVGYDEFEMPIRNYRGLKYIDEETAYESVFLQMLTGDTVDNIQGLKGIGKVRAAKILENRNPFIAVAKEYHKHYKENWRYEFSKSYKLLKIGHDNTKENTK